ncbi:MAG: alpha/beta fold hydrolase, partial [Pseudomonadota bacterium]
AAAYPGAYPWLVERDFVVFGQRGTEFAEPALMCPEYRQAIKDSGDKIRAAQDCRARLRSAGTELSNYNSETSAADIEDLRRVLNVDAWTLYGLSYGTRLALTYARAFPDNVAAMVLDSPLPPNARYDDASATNFESALRAVAKDCTKQPNCAAAFPNLEARFFQTIESVTETPLSVDFGNRRATGADLAGLIDMTSPKGIREAPFKMDAISRRDPDVLASLGEPPAASNFAWGMRWSVWCAEAWPFSDRSRSPGPGPTLGGFESAAIDPEICGIWEVPPLGADIVAPVVSDIPTLIFAGEFDPLTPPSWGQLAAETLSDALIVSVRGEGHLPTQQWAGDGCAMALAGAFVQDPETVLDHSPGDFCVFAKPAPRYLTGAVE